MRIGTWNFDSRSIAERLRIIGEVDCDLWLLTEVAAGRALAGGAMVFAGTDEPGSERRGFVASRRRLPAGRTESGNCCYGLLVPPDEPVDAEVAG